MWLTGQGVSPGIAFGKVWIRSSYELDKSLAYDGSVQADDKLNKVRETFQQTKGELHIYWEKIHSRDEAAAKIFESYMQILEDEGVFTRILEMLEREKVEPEYAIEAVFDERIKKFAMLENPIFAEREADLRDIKRLLLDVLSGKHKDNLSFIKGEVILVADEVLPSDMLRFNPSYVKGVVTERGSSTSHAAILARSLGIPMIVGVEGIQRKVSEEDSLGIDGESGEVVVNPLPMDIEKLSLKSESLSNTRIQQEIYGDKTIYVNSGERLWFGINVVNENFVVDESCYDYVGLYRTEHLYLRGNQAPTEEEQLRAYKHLIQSAKGKWVTIRTVDIGEDKVPDYMQAEEKGIRYCLQHPELFVTQLRAILRASVYGKVQIIFPKVVCIEEVRQAKRYVQDCMEQLDREGFSFDNKVPIGIMIETPSIALLSEVVAKEVDFASIGTNDLMQYLLGVERGTVLAEDNSIETSQELWNLIQRVVNAFNQENKPLSVCGEMAGVPQHAVELIRMGIRNLSMDAVHIPQVKSALLQMDRMV